ncbi:MAG TPA: hypothetical protein DCG75_06965 [Bacteroidales bacterium]|nr:hypothetical protein [Bacteroidales bacterium]
MRVFNAIKLIILVIIIQSCASSKFIEEGNTAFNSQNYEEALKSYDQIIESLESNGKKAKAPVYANAGISALQLEQFDKAQKFLESAKELQYSSPELYESLAKVYRVIDNLSKEITALETYREKYPQGVNIKTVNVRLIETYVESENWELAMNIWSQLKEQAQSDVNLLASYLTINKNLNNTVECDNLAKQISNIDSNNTTVLEYYAEKYFWKAENLYTTEMKAYKEHRTSSQYKKLLKALDEVWPNFQKSRDYFLKLHNIDPKPEYAGYLAKIYTRYDDKQKAAYYEKKAK